MPELFTRQMVMNHYLSPKLQFPRTGCIIYRGEEQLSPSKVHECLETECSTSKAERLDQSPDYAKAVTRTNHRLLVSELIQLVCRRLRDCTNDYLKCGEVVMNQ